MIYKELTFWHWTSWTWSDSDHCCFCFNLLCSFCFNFNVHFQNFAAERSPKCGKFSSSWSNSLFHIFSMQTTGCWSLFEVKSFWLSMVSFWLRWRPKPSRLRWSEDPWPWGGFFSNGLGKTPGELFFFFFFFSRFSFKVNIFFFQITSFWASYPFLISELGTRVSDLFSKSQVSVAARYRRASLGVSRYLLVFNIAISYPFFW